MPKNHILNAGVLALLVGATAMNWLWVWGLFFIYISVQSLLEGATFVVTPIRKEEAPTLFWVVSGFWLLSGASYIFFV